MSRRRAEHVLRTHRERVTVGGHLDRPGQADHRELAALQQERRRDLRRGRQRHRGAVDHQATDEQPVVVGLSGEALLRPDAARAAGLPQAWVHDFSADGVGRSLDESLARLGTDRLDAVFVHDPEDREQQVLTETWPAVARWRDEGTVRAVGIAACSSPTR